MDTSQLSEIYRWEDRGGRTREEIRTSWETCRNVGGRVDDQVERNRRLRHGAFLLKPSSSPSYTHHTCIPIHTDIYTLSVSTTSTSGKGATPTVTRPPRLVRMRKRVSTREQRSRRRRQFSRSDEREAHFRCRPAATPSSRLINSYAALRTSITSWTARAERTRHTGWKGSPTKFCRLVAQPEISDHMTRTLRRYGDPSSQKQTADSQYEG